MNDLLFVKGYVKGTQTQSYTTTKWLIPHLFCNEKSSGPRNNRIRAFQISRDEGIKPPLESFVNIREAELLTEWLDTFPSIEAVNSPYGIIPYVEPE